MTDCGFLHYDVVFGVPMSMLVTEENFTYLKVMLGSYVSRADIDSGNTKVGVVVYGPSVNSSSMIIGLNEFNKRDLLLQRILNFTYVANVSQSASVYQTLHQIEEMFKSDDNRTHIPNVAFLTVDTSSNFTGAVEEAQELRDLNVTVYVIAVGFTDISLPRMLGYNQSERFVQAVNNYAALAGNNVPFTDFQLQLCSKLNFNGIYFIS